MIRNMGKDHWKTLQCHEGTPNLVFQGHFPNAFNTTSNNNHINNDDQNTNKIEDSSGLYRSTDKH